MMFVLDGNCHKWFESIHDIEAATKDTPKRGLPELLHKW